MRRYREIASVFIKNRLGFLFAKMALSKDPTAELAKDENKLDEKSVGERIRNAFEELGPTFIKLGQILSTRTDLIPEGVARQLSKLQDHVPQFSFEEAGRVIEEELKEPVLSAYKSFDTKPVAAASVSQVYKAVLHSGREVAVKVQRPNILDQIEQDMGILLKIARYIDKHTKYGQLYDFEGMVEQLKSVMELEMNFIHEGENIDRFRKDFEAQPNVNAPKVYWMYTTKKVLTMDFVNGIKINDVKALNAIGADKQSLAEIFTDSLVKQMLVDGFFHADPHPGNVMVVDGGRQIEFIDMGMAGELPVRFRTQLTRMLMGVATRNTREIAESILDMDTSGNSVNLYKFYRTLDSILDQYLYGSVENVNIAKVFTSVFTLASDFKLKIAGEFALVAKALGTAQIIIEELAPNTSMLKLVAETAGSVLKAQFNPKDIIRDWSTRFSDASELTKHLPVFLMNLMRKTEENDFAVKVEIEHLKEIDENLERVSSRISFTVILLALCMLLAGVIVAIGMQARTDVVLLDVSLFALRAGLVVAAVIIVGLLFNVIYTNIKKR